jgi:hypothetical protein
MLVHKTPDDLIVDIYPFVDSTEELPSARISVYNKEVTYQGQVFSKEDVEKLTAAFAEAFKVVEQSK